MHYYLKIRNYVNTKTLRNIYFAIFHCHLSYLCIAWAQNFHTVRRLFIVQKKALRIMNFKDQLFQSSLRFFSNNILKFGDKIILEDILFVSKSVKGKYFMIGLYFQETYRGMKLAGQ